MSTIGNTRIAPAEGKLGVLIPGIGAVSTTFMAGVEAVKRGLGQPIGSLTQLGTVRLGKRTEGRSPMIKDFVPLAGLNDLVFGGWDIFNDTAYESAVHAAVLDAPLLEKVREPLSAIKPMKAVFDHEYVRRLNGPNVKETGSKMDKAEMLMEDIRQFRETNKLERMVMIWCGSTEVFHKSGSRAPDAEGFRVRLAEERSGHRAQPDLRLCRVEERCALCQWRAEPDHRHARRCWNWLGIARSRSAARISRPDRRS